MKISYDKATDSLYIHLSDRASVDSNEVSDGVVLDYDANGALVGIDVQHASDRADLSNFSLSQLPFGNPVAAYHFSPSDQTRGCPRFSFATHGNPTDHRPGPTAPRDGTIARWVFADPGLLSHGQGPRGVAGRFA